MPGVTLVGRIRQFPIGVRGSEDCVCGQRYETVVVQQDGMFSAKQARVVSRHHGAIPRLPFRIHPEGFQITAPLLRQDQPGAVHFQIALLR